VQPKGDIWYAPIPVGVNTLASTVQKLCKSAGFPGFFANDSLRDHSLRATAARRKFDANVDEQLIMHKPRGSFA